MLSVVRMRTDGVLSGFRFLDALELISLSRKKKKKTREKNPKMLQLSGNGTL